MATHSSVLAWRIPGTEERGGLLSEISQSRTRLKRLSSSNSSLLFALRASAKPIFFQFLMVQALHMLFSLPGCSSSPSGIFMKVLVTLLCLTFCYTMDRSLPGFSIHRIFQARVLEWGAIAFHSILSNSLQPHGL